MQPTPISKIDWWKVHYQKVKSFLDEIIDLRHGVNPAETIEEIKIKKSLSGANAWMLMCSIMIASIGLSQDSQAVIIGAMLISPLMSPILGIGLSVGVNDMQSLKDSLRHFLIAILIALLTSTIYFYFTPFDGFTDEIEARTSPTFLDIGIAIFGGIAGIISISRKDVSTTLPGVAIATALMPPLCVTGYGIAQADWASASKSFYLFFVNTFFVAFSTYLIIRYLRFPYTKYPDQRSKRRSMIMVGIFALAMLIPSFLIFRRVVRELKQKISLNQFKSQCLADDIIFLDDFYLDYNAATKSILYLKVYGDVINESGIGELESCLAAQGLQDTEIRILSSSDVKLQDVKTIEADIDKIQSELKASQVTREVETQKLKYAEQFMIDSTLFKSFSEEMKILHPTLAEIGVGKSQFSGENVTNLTCVLLLKWNKKPKNESEFKTIETFAAKRLQQKIRLINFD